MSITFSFIIIIISVYVMKRCSYSFDIASSFLTKNLAEGIKGPTINAIASSLPELFISFMFLFYFKDVEGFSAGFATIIGSSAFNIAVIPTISFLFVYNYNKHKVFKIDKLIIKQDVLFLLFSIVILMFGLFFGINFYFSIILILFYCTYIFFVIKKRSKLKSNIDENNFLYKPENSFYRSIINLDFFSLLFSGRLNKISSLVVLLLSVLIIGVSCYFLVISTDQISDFFDINIFFGAFIIAAIGSSIPDTLLSIQDAKNSKFSDSFSNAFGSNIFDICIGIGLPVLIYSIIYQPIDTSLPIERIGFIGNYIFSGNLFLWSLLSLFIFTSTVSFIYYKKSLDLYNSFKIIFLYLLFLIALILF